MNTETKIREFLLGNIDIVSFRQEYDANDDINDFLQNIVDTRVSSGVGFILSPRNFDSRIKFVQNYLYCFAQPDL